jgi:hypothetical protein
VYFLLLLQLVGHTGNHATVVGPMTRQQYIGRYGAPPGAGNTNGYSNRLLASAAAARYNANPQPSAGPAQAPSDLTGPGGKIPGAPSITNPLGGIAAIGDFFNRLTQPNTWIRVGEVVAGLLLVWVGFNAITRDTAVGKGIQSAKRGATKVAKVIPK